MCVLRAIAHVRIIARARIRSTCCPAELGHRPRALARLQRLRARRVAGQRARHHALQDAGHAEHVVGHVEAPFASRSALPSRRRGADSVATYSSSVGMPSAARSPPRRPRNSVGDEPPGHHVIREIRHRMAERRELPVEHREHARLGRMEDHVVEAVVAVDDRRLVARRECCCGSHSIRRSIASIFSVSEALYCRAPAIDLAREVVARLAVVGETDGRIVDAVQRRDDAIHLVEDRAALARLHARQQRVPQHAPLDVSP